MGGITAKMKRILDIDKILEDREKEKQKTYWQRIKNDPVKFGHYRREQYVNKKKEALSPLMTNGTAQSNHPLKSEVSVVNHIYELGMNSPNKIEEFDFADTPYQEQSEISKTVNQQEDEEIDFSDSPANLDIEEEGFLLDSDPAVIWPK